ncbi:hypothetical protein [Streptomyces sp. NPDC005012]|uniref:hypothetical protein n=1 Tax=unclassified Streptomyces TaxID=2593676 RepID=UPI0033B48EE4
MPEQWPEGRFADPEAARARYDAGLRGSRGAVREVLRADVSDAHWGVATVALAATVVGLLVAPVLGAAVAAGFAALYLGTLAVMHARGVRGSDAVRRSYCFAFGWGKWVDPTS